MESEAGWTYFVFREGNGGRAVACFCLHDHWSLEHALRWSTMLVKAVSSRFWSEAGELAAIVVAGVMGALDDDQTIQICPIDDALYSDGTVVLVEASPLSAPGTMPFCTVAGGGEIHALLDPGFAALRNAAMGA